MKYILLAFTKLFRFLGKFKGFLPIGIPGLFLVIQFFINGFGKSWTFALSHLAKVVLASELTINEGVHLAISNSSSYNFWVFLDIILAVYILFNLIRFLSKVVLSITGANEKAWGGFVIAIIIVAILEVSVIKVIDNVWVFPKPQS